MVGFARIHEDPDLAANRQTSSLAALALLLGLIVASLFVVERLRTEAQRQDCAVTGRVVCLAPANE
jgi:hypothetical protein